MKLQTFLANLPTVAKYAPLYANPLDRFMRHNWDGKPDLTVPNNLMTDWIATVPSVDDIGDLYMLTLKVPAHRMPQILAYMSRNFGYDAPIEEGIFTADYWEQWWAGNDNGADYYANFLKGI